MPADPAATCTRGGAGKPTYKPWTAAVAAAAKISMAALEETPRQDPEAGLCLDQFTLKPMYSSKGSLSKGGMCTVMVSHTAFL